MNITHFLDYASHKYYEGNPIIPDDVFDTLAEENNYESVGYESSDNNVKHVFPMYSLQKVYSEEKDPNSIFSEKTVITPKLDGVAVSLTYIRGALALVATRGNGTKGKDVTGVGKFLKVPSTIILPELAQINGEVVAPQEIPNARNYAAGAMNLKDPEEFKTRNLTFVAYSIQPTLKDSYSEDLSFLKRMGFYTLLDELDAYPQDGQVWRVDNHKAFEALGYTSHHPRGAFALKTRSEGVITKLLNVVWQVGKSGVVSPVAILEPINIGGATVSKATLHNMKYINDLNLELGCDVEVIRSGEIIPRVVRRVGT